MNKTTYLVKQKWLQDLKNDYILKLENFMKDVETSMQSQNKDRANENFETAVDFLTQPFPDVQNLMSKPVDNLLMLKQKMSKVSKKLDSVNTNFESFRAQTAIRLNKTNTRLNETNEHVGSLKKLQKIFKSKIETVPGVVAISTSNTAMAVTSPSHGATPKVQDHPAPYVRGETSMSRVLVKVGHPLSRTFYSCQKNYCSWLIATTNQSNFSLIRGQITRAATRWWGPWGILRDKLLGPQPAGGVPGVSLGDKLLGPQPAGGVPGVSLGDKLPGPQLTGGVLGVSFGDKLLGPQPAGGVPGVSLGDKLLGPQPAGGVPGAATRGFYTAGDHLYSLKLSSFPRRLALIDSGLGNIWKVGVTLPMEWRIAILEVTPDSVTQMTSIQTYGDCWAITAVDTGTLAVGYDGVPGIDLIDMTGRFLRRLSKSLDTQYL
ncbi:hypothetical protein RRG08_061628 [Elysia crispata]|uniref:Uncharacterized protein n=1 Tax=Elysia crispata TaxID=231223 RepID=A0AAE0YU90_9GAST|nr:hypothetical protein RRG08_061628 [Elysia crispata]